MEKLINSGIFIAIISVFFGWGLSQVKLSDELAKIEYSAGGSDIINAKDKIASNLKIYAGDSLIDKLTIYNIKLSNTSKENLKDIKFEIKATNRENGKIIASTLKGPKGFSDKLFKKVSEDNDSVVYSIDYINVPKNESDDYFLVSILFSNEQPEKISLSPLSPGIQFVDKNESSKPIIYLIVFLAAYVGAIMGVIWLISKGSAKTAAKRNEQLTLELNKYLIKNFNIEENLAKTKTDEIINLRSSIFNPKNSFKKKLVKWLNSN